MILNIIVSWYLACLVSKVSHSRCLSMDVTLLVFLYRCFCYVSCCPFLYHLQLIGVILGVWAPDWAAVLQYGSYKGEVCSSLRYWLLDFSPRSLTCCFISWWSGWCAWSMTYWTVFPLHNIVLSPQLLRYGLWEYRSLNVDSWILRFSVCYIYLDGRPSPTFSPNLRVER